MSLYNESAVIVLMSTVKPIPSRGPASYNNVTHTGIHRMVDCVVVLERCDLSAKTVLCH